MYRSSRKIDPLSVYIVNKQSCSEFFISSLYNRSYLASTMNWETCLAVIMKILVKKLVEVVLEHAVDEAKVVFDHRKLH